MREMIKYRDYLIKRLADPKEALAYLQTSIEEYQKDGDTVALIIALESIAKAQVQNKELASHVYLLSGGVHHLEKEYDRAIENYTKAMELKPDDAIAYSNRGAVYHDKCDDDHALADYGKAIELNPNLSEAYNNRGNIYHNNGNDALAIEDYTKAIELNPNYADAYYNRSIVYSDKGNDDLAIIDYTKSIELNLTHFSSQR